MLSFGIFGGAHRIKRVLFHHMSLSLFYVVHSIHVVIIVIRSHFFLTHIAQNFHVKNIAKYVITIISNWLASSSIFVAHIKVLSSGGEKSKQMLAQANKP